MILLSKNEQCLLVKACQEVDIKLISGETYFLQRGTSPCVSLTGGNDHRHILEQRNILPDNSVADGAALIDERHRFKC